MKDLQTDRYANASRFPKSLEMHVQIYIGGGGGDVGGIFRLYLGRI